PRTRRPFSSDPTKRTSWRIVFVGDTDILHCNTTIEAMEILSTPVAHPSAWTADVVRDRTDWILHWPAEAIAELESAAAGVRCAGKAMPGFTREDFPLPRTGAFL